MRALIAAGLLALAFSAGCDDASSICGSSCSNSDYPVRTNSIGYLPTRTKRATWAGEATSFRVLRADGSVAYEGDAGDTVSAPDSGEELRVGDFSVLDEEGTFSIVVDGVGKSPEFRIGQDVFVEPMRTLMLGFYGQRCGASVSIDLGERHYSHHECHLGDATLVQPDTEEVADVTKGWHDAGDYGKYVNNGSFSLGMMLLAWEQFAPALGSLELPIPEAGGALPDYLDECAFQLAWLFGMQRSDGGVADRVTTASFDAANTRPELSTAQRKLAPPSSVATADFAAVMAMAARVYAPYDTALAERALGAAESAQAWLVANPDAVQPDLSTFTGGYNSDDGDDRLWALAELWQATGNAEYLAAFEGSASSFDVRSSWDWPDLGNLGIFTYLLSEREGRDSVVVGDLTQKLLGSADGLAESAFTHAYGRALGEQYYWGINGVVARSVLNLRVAEKLSGDARYLDASTLQIDHLLGRNYFGRSQATGIGVDPPKHPHHRPSTADNRPWPGLVVGGPHSKDAPPATVWRDDSNDYETNEVAINWMAALAYAMAGFLPQ